MPRKCRLMPGEHSIMNRNIINQLFRAISYFNLIFDLCCDKAAIKDRRTDRESILPKVLEIILPRASSRNPTFGIPTI
jgi:hypothetical protein